MTRKPTSYWDYIRIEELTRLQGGLEADDAHLANDEVMFIAIHQIDELWFKLAIRELVAARNLFRGEMVREQTLSTAVRALSRTTTIFGHASAHFSLMETMTTRDYLGFRDKLSPASGFQSAQLREIEILFGLEDSQRIPLGNEKDYRRALSAPDGTPSPSAARVAERLADTPHLKEAIDAWLFRTPIYGSQPHMPDDERAVLEFLENYLGAHEQEVRRAQSLATFPHQTAEERAKLQERYDREIVSARSYLLAEDVAEFPTGNREVGGTRSGFAGRGEGEGSPSGSTADRSRRRRIRAALLFIESYRELPLLAWPRELLEALVELEQAFVIFRQRHARMVERIIGRRTGTGGSAGVDYLDQTALRYRIFSELWATRTLLIRAEALPKLQRAEAYALPVET